MSQVTLYSLAFAAIGILFIGLGLPLIFNRVPPNNWYGFRTKKTLSSTKYWYAANRIAGKDLSLAGLIQAISAIIILFFGQSLKPQDVVCILILVMVSTLIGALVNDFRELNKM